MAPWLPRHGERRRSLLLRLLDKRGQGGHRVLGMDHLGMALALAEARAAAAHDDVPVGCVVVDEGGRVIASAHNERELSGDPTAHAEIIALRRAAEVTGVWRLLGTTMFVTLEPCAMCAGALVNARVGRVVWGADDPKWGAMSSRYNIGVDGKLNHRVETCAGVLADHSVELLRHFFAAKRRTHRA